VFFEGPSRNPVEPGFDSVDADTDEYYDPTGSKTTAHDAIQTIEWVESGNGITILGRRRA
jgi:hypothetical protein